MFWISVEEAELVDSVAVSMIAGVDDAWWCLCVG